ncbi:MAG: YihY/virulence factor BrkB family protein [Actinobacteria bacterium]|nr:YihY/virulence factor BrkB family protein [Actinomycetota bacterium]
MSTRIAVLMLALSTLVLTACEQPVQKPQQGDMVVRKWIAAAVNNDGQTYCGLMTTRLLATTTGQSGDNAKKTCEREIKAGTGQYPFPVIVFLVWLWISNLAILLGAEFNAQRRRT